MARQKLIWCPTRLVLETIEGKWTAHIIRELLSGTKRHTEIAKALNGINPRTLTDRLRDLEHGGIVRRKMYEEIPPRVEYSLTARGRDLLPILEALKSLGMNWKRTANVSVFTHDNCPHCFSNGASTDGDGNGSSAGGVAKSRRKRVKR